MGDGARTDAAESFPEAVDAMVSLMKSYIAISGERTGSYDHIPLRLLAVCVHVAVCGVKVSSYLYIE